MPADWSLRRECRTSPRIEGIKSLALGIGLSEIDRSEATNRGGGEPRRHRM
jgi:hypothetical protein